MVIRYSTDWLVPAHITGLFQIVENSDPLHMGSRGAGFSIDNYFITRAELKKTKGKKIDVYFNDVLIDGNVTNHVAMNFHVHWKKKGLVIKHYSQLIMGAGFGASGGGAIGTAFCLNELFQTNHDNKTLGHFAHKAEVVNRTGLGDVISQMKGGPEIRLKPGAPGIGKIISFKWPSDQMIVSVTLGPMSTKDVITSKKHIEEINATSESLLKELIKRPTVDFFVEASFTFASHVNLMSERIKKLVLTLHDEGYKTSMIMIGESLFVVCLKEEIPKCIETIKSLNPEIKYWINKIAEKGPSIVLKK